MRIVLIGFVLCLLFSSLSRADDYNMLTEYAAERVNHARENAPVPVDGAFGDELSLYQGTVAFNNVDTSVPGNNQLPVELRRTFAVQDRRETATTLPPAGQLGGFGDWNIDLPNLHGTFAATTGWQVEGSNPNARCSAPNIPTYSVGGFSAYDYWDGYSLRVPGAADQELLVNNIANSPKPTNGTSYPWITKGFWVVSCKATTANGYPGESFIATSPEGIRYTFDWAVSKAASGLRRGPSSIQRVTVYFLATRVEDRFGNWVTYTYSGNNLSKVESSDGRTITLAYSGGNIFSVTSDAGVWTYGYTNGRLTSVQLPGGSTWTYSRSGRLSVATEYQDVGGGRPDQACTAGLITGDFTYTVTNPSRSTAVFTFSARRHVREYVPKTCSSVPNYGSYLRVPIYFDILSLVSKTVTGASLPTLTWSYSYNGSGYRSTTYYGACGATCPTTKSTTVLGPNSTYDRYTYGIKYKANEGQLISKATGSSSSTILQTLTNTYITNEEVPSYPFVSDVGTTLGSSLRDSFSAASLRPLRLAQTAVNGDTFTTASTTFDNFARPLSVTRSNSASETRTDVTAYYDDLSRWVLGQIKSKTNSDTGRVESFATYHAATALRENVYAFDLLQRTVAYNPDGTVASLKDGLNRTTTLSNWKRGVPRSVGYPDSASKSAVVNNSGTIASVTDERVSATTYGYDALSRLASVAYPPSDTVAWSPETITRLFVSGELGLPANTWRVRTTVGAHQVSVYHDALLRPVLTEDKDTTTGLARYVRRSFDHEGRTTFESYPSSSSSATAGINSTYDALGRFRRSQTTDGIVLEQIDYLASKRRQITDADNKVTTITYQAFDTQEDGPPIRIEAPESQTTVIARDVFGKITSVTQSGTWSGGSVSAARGFTYDNYQRPCRRVNPESGSTVWGYNAASEVIWEAKGQSGSGCIATMPSGGTVFQYDLRGRKVKDDYLGSTEDVIYAYADKINLTSVTAPAATWTYSYNKRNLLETEQAVVDGKTFLFDPSYNALGQRSQLTTPAQTISYSPDALGRPKQIGTWATNIQYHPNGLPASYTLGSGLTFTQSLDSRLRPSTQETKNGGTFIQRLVYGYSNAGDLNAIDDTVDSTDDLTATYDNLHRLKTATGLWGGYSYTYDPLNNIRSRSGPSSLTYGYDATNNRLTGISGSQSRGYSYNVRGEITGDGTKTFTLNSLGQIASVTGVATYTYDGLAKRIKTVKGGVTEYALYDLSGQLVYTESGTTKTDFLSLNGQTLVELKKVATTTTPTYLHPDLLGSPRKATNQAKIILWQEHFDPYGRKLNGINEKIGYTGHAHDQETGYTYAQARFYDAQVGRFLSIDPVDFQDSSPFTFNRYSYANNNPYRHKDPNGESPIDVAFLAIDGIGLGVAIASGNPAAIQSAAIDFGLSVIGVASPVPGTGQALKAARGGVEAVNKGKEGVKVAKEFLEARGLVSKGEEITAKTASGRTKFDDVMQDGDGLIGVEVKNGPTAKLNTNQRTQQGNINSGEANTLVGGNAGAAGIEGRSLDSSMTIHVEKGQVTKAYCVVKPGGGGC